MYVLLKNRKISEEERTYRLSPNFQESFFLQSTEEDNTESLLQTFIHNTPSESIMTLDLELKDSKAQSQEGVTSVFEHDDLQSSLTSERMINSSLSQDSHSEESPIKPIIGNETMAAVESQLNETNLEIVNSDTMTPIISYHSGGNVSENCQQTELNSFQVLDLSGKEDSESSDQNVVVEPTASTTSTDIMKVDIKNQDIEDDSLDLQSQFNPEPNIMPATQLNDDIKKSKGLKIFDMECMTTVESMPTEKYDNTVSADKEVPSLPKDDLLSLSSSRQSSSDKSGVSEKEGATSLAIDHTVTSESDIEAGTATKYQGILIKSTSKKSSIKAFTTVSFASGSHELISSKSDEAKEESSIVSESTDMTTSTFGTLYTFNTMGSETTLGAETLLKGDYTGYITQRFGFINLMLSITQLFSLTMTLSLCGFAPIAFNYGLGPYADTLSQAGALNPYLFLEQGQYWRLFTAPLLTSSVLHFLINGFFQVEAGAFIEREWGSLRLFIIYIFSAFGATTVSCIFAPNVVSVTSSSALFGVLGAKYSEFLMVLNFRTKQNRIRRDYYIQQIKVIVCISMVILSMCLFSYIEVSGVLGGFVFGFTSGMILLYPQLMKKQDKILWAGTGLSLMILLMIAVLFLLRQTNPPEEMEDVCNYYESFHYEGYNCQCLI